MTYVLGFFCADGNLTAGQRGNKYIEFTSTDLGVIRQVKSAMRSGHKISSRKRKRPWKTAFRLQIGSNKMFEDLINFGLKPNKSKRLAYPVVPDKYFHHFVRGYFDGDGHVTTGTYKRLGSGNSKRVLFAGFTCGTKKFLEKMWRSLMGRNIVSGGTLYHQNRAYRLTFSIQDSLALYQFLYKNLKNSLYLSRKKRVFEKYINAVVA